MDGSRDLFTLGEAAASVPAGVPLVAALTGFADAGSAVALLTSHLRDELNPETVALFDNEHLLDYRARRPIFTFEQDRLTEYTPPRLSLELLHDDLDRPFLLLSGFEPDFRWESFVASVLGLIEHFDVSTVTWVHSIPMPVPHTRPIGVTVSGNRPDLIEAMSVWRPETQLPANVLHLLEYSLQDSDRGVAGFVLLVPHYLADTEYPDSVVKSLECVMAATRLILPTDAVREEGREFVSRIDEQVAENGELGKLVGALQKRYDAYMEGQQPMRSPLTDSDGELPTADEIAAELEKFLANRPPADDDPLAP